MKNLIIYFVIFFCLFYTTCNYSKKIEDNHIREIDIIANLLISDKEMMCVYTAEELLELDASKITNEHLKKVLNSLNEESNPIVAIVALKD